MIKLEEHKNMNCIIKILSLSTVCERTENMKEKRITRSLQYVTMKHQYIIKNHDAKISDLELHNLQGVH